MIRKRTLLFTLVLALLTLLSVAPTAHGQQRRFVADSGVVTPGENELLRIVINGRDGNDTITVGFRRIGYVQGACNNGLCTYTIGAQAASGPITLQPGEAASIDIPRSFMGGVFVGVRGVVLSSSRNVRVTFQIINTSTGVVESVWDDTDIVHV